MNEKNLEYLSKQVLYTGFGEGHRETLKEKIGEQQPEFSISHQQEFGKDTVVAMLQFSKSKENDLYFFNRYNILMKTGDGADTLKQTFYINNDTKRREQQDITFKEGYNLMSGRAIQKDLVTKEGEKYKAWLQLDFKETDKHGNFIVKQFHENYGYDLKAALAKQPIKELSDETASARLLTSLERGNRQSVTLVRDGKEEKVFIEAAPKFKSLNMYDSNMKRVNAQTLKEGKKENQSQGQSLKAGGDDEPAAARQSQKNNKRKGQRVS